MTSTSVGIGNPEAQRQFVEENKPFFEESPFLTSLIEQVFLNRTINPPPDETIEKLEHLPDNHPDVLAVNDKYNADLIVYMLGRIAIDDFNELVVLAANGWGIGSLKILRGMYERVVTSGYIAKYPIASRDFTGSLWTHKWKVWNRAVGLIPSLIDRTPSNQVTFLEVEAKRAQARKNESYCKLCGQLKRVEAWTQLDLLSMARKVDKNIEDLYLACYLEPTAHMHATGAGIDSRIERLDDGWTYRCNTAPEARMALQLGHTLILHNLGIQDDYFSLGIDKALEGRLQAWMAIWGRVPAEGE